MKFQVIDSSDETCLVQELASIARPVPEGSKRLYTFEALTFEAAMTEFHHRQGYEPYKPEGEATPCLRCGDPVYQEGSGDCGKCGSAKIEPLSGDEVEGILFYARYGMAHGSVFDNCAPETLVALCEEVLALRVARGV